jgi:predicted MFS family arabinose efflux permease
MDSISLRFMPYRSERNGYKNIKSTWKVYLLALICFVISISEFVIVGVLDKIAASANISISAAGQLIIVFAIAGVIGTPIGIMATSSRGPTLTTGFNAALIMGLPMGRVVTAAFG